MGWKGELNGLVLNLGQKLISQAELAVLSDSCSEVLKLDQVEATYRPHDPAQLEQLYKAVEPSGLISK